MRLILLLALLLAACSKGAEADLSSIGEARSLAAEWALVNQQAAKGHLTGIYVSTMRKALREQLKTASSSLTQPDSAYGKEIEALLGEPDNAAPTQLRSHAARLKAIEDQLESA